MIDKIISALESMQEDMEEHGELQKARGVSSAIWLIEFMKDFADRKTEPQTEECNAYVVYNGDGDVIAEVGCEECDRTDCAWK